MRLRLHSPHHDHVSELQDALNQTLPNHVPDYEPLVTDGDYGHKTQDAVSDLQEVAGLEEMDGVIIGEAGPITLETLGLDWAYADAEGMELEDEYEHVEGADGEVDADTIVAMVSEALPLWRESAHDRLIDSISGALSLVADKLPELNLVTPLAWSHLLGHMREETGANFTTKENLNYKCSVLPKLFRNFRNAPDKAEKYGRCNGHPADQVAIANIAYGFRKDLGNTEEGDGGLFLGAGAHQLTGRYNYQGFDEWLAETLPEFHAALEGQIMEYGWEAVSQAPLDVLSMIYFWTKSGMSDHATDLSRNTSEKLTNIINKHIGADSRQHRFKFTVQAANYMGIA